MVHGHYWQQIVLRLHIEKEFLMDIMRSRSIRLGILCGPN